jgi:hypothetical protein
MVVDYAFDGLVFPEHAFMVYPALIAVPVGDESGHFLEDRPCFSAFPVLEIIPKDVEARQIPQTAVAGPLVVPFLALSLYILQFFEDEWSLLGWPMKISSF